MSLEGGVNRRRVFISYSGLDAEWARAFAHALEDRGVRVWIDQLQIQPGEPIRAALEAGLRESDILVALIDSDPRSTPNLYFELGAAVGLGKRIVPIIPRDVDVARLPLELRLRQHLVKDSPEETADELYRTLAAA